MARTALRIVNFGTSKTGLSTVGYTVYDTSRNVAYSRSTSGVGEIGSGTGIYSAIVTLPDDDAVVLWDTGEATPKYSTEDYQAQIGRIQDETDKIQKIWNSIKNQGEFMSALMDRFGLIEKNIGLQKIGDKLDELSKKENNVSLNNIEDAFNKATSKIKFTTPDIKIPDNSEQINKLENKVNSLQADINKIPKSQKEYSGNFTNLLQSIEKTQSTLLTKIDEINKLNKAGVDSVSSDISKKHNNISQNYENLSISIKNIAESLNNTKTVFAKFDSILNKIGDLNNKISSLDSNDKDISKTIDKDRRNISEEIARLNSYMSSIFQIVSNSQVSQEAKSMILAFGHKRGK